MLFTIPYGGISTLGEDLVLRLLWSLCLVFFVDHPGIIDAFISFVAAAVHLVHWFTGSLVHWITGSLDLIWQSLSGVIP